MPLRKWSSLCRTIGVAVVIVWLRASFGGNIGGAAPMAAISSYLFSVALPRQIPHPNCRPAKFGHNLCKTTKSARSPVALRDFKKIQQCLTADALQPIKEVDLAPHALKREPPRIGCSAAAAFAASSRILSLNVNALISHSV